MSKEKNLSLKNPSIPNQKKSMGNKKSYYYLLSIILLTAFVYSPTFENDFVDWDDDWYVEYNNSIIEGNVSGMFNIDLISVLEAAFHENKRKELDKTSFIAGNYHPFTVYSLYLNYLMGGMNPFGYQFTNILLHLLNVLLVFFLLKRFLPDKHIGVLFGTVLFAIHPMHVESVSWISERKDVLYSFFFLLGMLTYWEYKKKDKYLYLFFTFILFIASCLSKPAAVVFPIILILIDLYLDKKIILEKTPIYIPFLLVSLIFGLITISSQGFYGAIGKIEHISLLERIILGGNSIMLYLFKFLFPINLSMYYPFPNSLSWYEYISFVLVLILLFTSFKFYKKYRLYSISFFFFLINLVLVLQIISVGAAMIAERYTYIPYIGLSIIFGLLIEIAHKKIKNTLVFIFIPLVFICSFSYSSYNRVKTWKNTEILFSDLIEKEPNYSLGWGKRGVFFKEQGDNNPIDAERNVLYNKALSDLNSALKIEPDNIINIKERGDIFFKKQMYNNAILDFKASYQLGDTSALLFTNMATTHYKLNNKKVAYEFYAKALRSDSTFRGAYYNRGIDLYSDKKYNEALNDFNRFIFYDSLNAGVYHTMGLCHSKLNNFELAVLNFSKAIKFIDANSSTTTYYDKEVNNYINNNKENYSEKDLAKYYYDRGVSYYKLGNEQAAIDDFIFAKKIGYQLPEQIKLAYGL